MNVRDLWVVTRSRAGLQDSEYGQLQFLDSLNSVRLDVNRRFKQTYTEVTVSDLNSNTDLGWEDYMDNSIRFGVIYYLQVTGAYSGDPDPEAWQRYRAHLGLAMTAAISGQSSFKTRTQAEE